MRKYWQVWSLIEGGRLEIEKFDDYDAARARYEAIRDSVPAERCYILTLCDAYAKA